MAKIQVKRGLQANVEGLALVEGEFAVALDTGNVYVGTSGGTVHVNPKGGTADQAVKLQNPRSFSISGDGTAAAVSFDGSENVNLVLTLSAMSGLAAGTYTKLTVDAKGRVTGATQLAVSDLPSIPTSKITGLGTAADLDTGTTAGKVVVVGADGKLPDALMPALAVSDTYEAESETEMLALSAQKGDICIRTDENKSYILSASPASTKANWKWLKTPDCKVLSVNGQTGAVTLAAADVGAAAASHTHTKRQITDFPASMPASDVPAWAKAASKPSYTAGEVGAAPSIHVSAAATASSLGHVKIGDGLSVTGGTVSVGDIDGGTF